MQKIFPYVEIKEKLSIQASEMPKVVLFSKGLLLRFLAFKNQSWGRSGGLNLCLKPFSQFPLEQELLNDISYHTVWRLFFKDFRQDKEHQYKLKLAKWYWWKRNVVLFSVFHIHTPLRQAFTEPHFQTMPTTYLDRRHKRLPAMYAFVITHRWKIWCFIYYIANYIRKPELDLLCPC